VSERPDDREDARGEPEYLGTVRRSLSVFRKDDESLVAEHDLAATDEDIRRIFRLGPGDLTIVEHEVFLEHEAAISQLLDSPLEFDHDLYWYFASASAIKPQQP
jgi:hypothetical protein